METDKFKSVMVKVVSECFPDETLVFGECSDVFIADLFAGRDIDKLNSNAGEFAWVEELKTGLEVGKSALEFFGAMLGIYKIWRGIRDQHKDKEEDLRERLRTSLIEAGVSPKKVDRVIAIVLSEIILK